MVFCPRESITMRELSRQDFRLDSDDANTLALITFLNFYHVQFDVVPESSSSLAFAASSASVASAASSVSGIP